MQLPIYLDYAASTPVDKRVLAKMLPYLSQTTGFGNPHANHRYGREAWQAIEDARQQVAAAINANPTEIIWMSGATEANNLALKGLAYAYQNKGKHIITTTIEHSSVIDTCEQLVREGYSVTYLQPEKNGLIDLTKLAAAIQKDTLLVSVMQVNNEIGVVQDIAAIGKLLRAKNIYFHVDAVQSVGKLPIDLKQLSVDLMSFSAHKIYGPKGIGALYINGASEIKLKPLLYGGGQEQSMRAGTLATHQIVGMGEAFAIMQQELSHDNNHVKALSDYFWQGLNKIDNIYLNGDAERKVPHILNIAFGGVEAKTLLPALKDIAVSTGSACHESRNEISYVLRNIGLSNELASCSLRFSLGRFTTKQEIDFAVEKIIKAIKTLRNIII